MGSLLCSLIYCFTFSSLPDGYTEDTLSKEEASLVSENWGFRRLDSPKYIQELISALPNVAVRDSNGTLVGHEAVFHFGALGMLYTHPGHRGKGIAKAIMSSMVQKQYQRGRVVHAYVEISNAASQKLHTSMGFKQQGELYSFVFCDP